MDEGERRENPAQPALNCTRTLADPPCGTGDVEAMLLAALQLQSCHPDARESSEKEKKKKM
jgi:hypothetical protein